MASSKYKYSSSDIQGIIVRDITENYNLEKNCIGCTVMHESTKDSTIPSYFGEQMYIMFIKENEIPLNFTGNNAAIIGFGFCDKERAIILNHNYRMMERYKSFYGYRILVSCGKDMSNSRPIGWTPINIYTFFNERI